MNAPRALPTLDVLLGPGSPTTLGTSDDDALVSLYRYPAAADPRRSTWVRANMVSSVDGGAWGPDHLSGTINDDADQRVFRVLRALADVVVIGAGTARAERYTALDAPAELARLRPSGVRLELAVVSRSGRLPSTLVGSDRPPYVLTGQQGAARARQQLPDERVLDVGSADDPEQPDVGRGLALLAERGLTRVLCEGGPHLLGDLVSAGLVDELCLTTTPLLVGAGPGRVVGGGGPDGPTACAPPVGARLAHLLHADGTLLARWLLRAAEPDLAEPDPADQALVE